MRIEFGFSRIGSPVQFCTSIEKPTLKRLLNTLQEVVLARRVRSIMGLTLSL
jgi:hypothetical protein